MKLIKSFLAMSLSLVTPLGLSIEQPTSKNAPDTIKVSDLHQIISTDAKNKYLIDVRTNSEWQSEHASPAIHIPMDDVSEATLLQHAIKKSDTIYVICAVGGRSAKVVDKLKKQGFNNAINVEGGTKAWVAAKLPTIR